MEQTEKLEILNEMKRRYPDWINKELLSIKFCRNTTMVYLEMCFSDSPENAVITDLNFISNDDLDGSLFLPETDIVDNANIFIQLDKYSLLMCVDGLFTEEAVEAINCFANK